MKKTLLASAILALGVALPASAGNIDGGAVVGGAVGGGAGAAVGSAVGGRDGAIIGGAIGGATGAAIGSSAKKQPAEKVVVKERVVKEVVYVEGDQDGPPGHGHGKKKGWKKHKHQED